MCDSFYRIFTRCCGVHKITVIHNTYPQTVHNTVEKRDFVVKNVKNPRFFNEKHLFSVDNPVHTVYKPVKNSKP